MFSALGASATGAGSESAAGFCSTLGDSALVSVAYGGVSAAFVASFLADSGFLLSSFLVSFGSFAVKSKSDAETSSFLSALSIAFFSTTVLSLSYFLSTFAATSGFFSSLAASAGFGSSFLS